MTQLQFNAALIDLKEKLHFYALSLTSDSEKADDLLRIPISKHAFIPS